MSRETDDGILQLNLDLSSAFRKLFKRSTPATVELGILCNILREKLKTSRGQPADNIIQQLTQLSNEINSILGTPNQDQRLESTARILRSNVSAAMPDLNADPDLRAFDENQVFNASFPLNSVGSASRSGDGAADTGAVASISSSSNNVDIQVKVRRYPSEITKLEGGTLDLPYSYSCPSEDNINKIVYNLRRYYKQQGKKLGFRHRIYAKYQAAAEETRHTRCRLRLLQVQGLDTVKAIQRETGLNAPVCMEFVIRDSEYVLGVVGEDPKLEDLSRRRLCKIIPQHDDFGIILDLEEENDFQNTLQRELPPGYGISCVLAGPEFQPYDRPLRWSEDGLQAHLQAYDCSLTIVIAPHNPTTVLQSMDMDASPEDQVPAVTFARTR